MYVMIKIQYESLQNSNIRVAGLLVVMLVRWVGGWVDDIMVSSHHIYKIFARASFISPTLGATHYPDQPAVYCLASRDIDPSGVRTIHIYIYLHTKYTHIHNAGCYAVSRDNVDYIGSTARRKKKYNNKMCKRERQNI